MKRTPWVLLCTGMTFSLVASLAACTDDGGDDDEIGETGEESTTAETTAEESAEEETAETTATTGPSDCADPNDPNAPVELISANIEGDATWTCDKIWALDQDVLVTVSGGVLTIDPGTTIKGLGGSALVIEKDARIEAVGTADAPIVFTSAQPDPGPSDWGGVVLLGSATSNCGVDCQAEGFVNPPTYAGMDDAHNCGTLAYVRVEYGGFPISEGNELNGITFYACGTGTTVHHVQSHMGSDDGIEMFGGTFDLDHIVVTGAQDDSLDMDQGFRGTAQHVFIHQDPAVGDNMFEISNQGMVFDATPLTHPTFCNVTAVGSGAGGDKSKGLTIKEGTEGGWFATIITNATGTPALLNDDATQLIVEAGGIEIRNNIFFGNLGDFQSGAAMLDNDAWKMWVMDSANANLESDPGLGSAAWGSPDVVPSGDVAGDGTVGSGCEPTNYIGAVELVVRIGRKRRGSTTRPD
ncbi:MAG: hypothetical protein HC927_00850 [Deltaproteobacteria bacterium]|nr:hypothetical protein [Deltaproteobacteria bacterium]